MMGLENFWVDERIEVLGGQCAGESMEAHVLSPNPIPYPMPLPFGYY